jgi:hypothetical protein
MAVPAGEDTPGYGEEPTDCWFDEPEPGDRRSWALPAAHGTDRGLDLELLDPDDEGERALLIEARHPEFADAVQSSDDVFIDGEAVNPRLHLAMHEIVANQLLADDPPETWQTVQRLAGLGYDWHNIMHMIAALVTEDVYGVLVERRKHDAAVQAIEGWRSGMTMASAGHRTLTVSAQSGLAVRVGAGRRRTYRCRWFPIR